MTILTQGGQISIHSFRMNVVIVRFIIRFFLIVYLLSAGTVFYIKTDKQTLKNTHDYYEAKMISLYQIDPNHKINIIRNGKNIKVRIIDILNNTYIIKAKEKTKQNILSSLKLSLIIASILTALLIIYFIVKGYDLGKSKHLRGGSILEPKKLARMVRNYNKRTLLLLRFIYRVRRILATIGILDKAKSYNQKQKQYRPYKVANNIPYPAHTETQHTLITGGSGTGKTQLLKHLLTQIKKNGDRAIVYDKMGSFIPHFYEPHKGDTILNPFDKRSPIWSIFNEVEETLQLDSIASALMPITKNISDPFWVQASRTIFTSVAGKMKEQGETSNKNLVDNLLKIDLSDIAKIIKGTPAQAIIDERSPKTALSVMSVLSTYLSSLKYLKDANVTNINGDIQKTFSIRDWVKDDTNSSFLFISSKGDQHESLKPLISTWLEIAVNSLLSIKQNSNRRIWIILDELPSLHMLLSLNSGIAESRQFGGCFVLSLQLMAQLRSIYGRDDAETISGLAKTRVIFSSPDEDTARWCSNSLGKKEQQEIRTNISYGASDIRDGVSLNTHQTMENLIIPTEINKIELKDSNIRDLINHSILILTEKESAFTKQDLLKQTLINNIEKRVTITSIEKEIENILKEKEILKIQSKNTYNNLLTTKQEIHRELQLIKHLEIDAKNKNIFESKNELQHHIEKNQNIQNKYNLLTDGQKQALYHILTSKEQVIGVQGSAGTGKTYMLDLVRELLQAKDKEFIALAPSSSATKLLRTCSKFF